MHGDGVLREFLHVGRRLAVSRVDRVALLRAREVDGRLRQRQVALRRARKLNDCMAAMETARACGSAFPMSSEAKRTIRRRCKAALRRLDHAREPVERRVGVGAPHALVERAYQVVVHLAFLVVDEHAFLVGLLHGCVVDDGCGGVAPRRYRVGASRRLRAFRASPVTREAISCSALPSTRARDAASTSSRSEGARKYRRDLLFGQRREGERPSSATTAAI